jgi:hypothetical protein
MESENNQVATVEDRGLELARPPALVLLEAKKAADALQEVLRGKKNPVRFNNEQYVEFEDWQVLGKFYGITAKIVSTTPVDFGEVRGFEARAVALDNRTGMEVSAADAMCLNDEDKWSSRPKYEYVNGKREKTGDIPVPMFQLRSMAQTRACSKALRNVLAWVVVLAGYKPTPAEEMTGEESPPVATPPIAQPQRKSEQPQEVKPATVSPQAGTTAAVGTKISEPQRKRLYAIYKTAKKTDDQVKAFLKETYGIESSAEIDKNDYEEICNWCAAEL